MSRLPIIHVQSYRRTLRAFSVFAVMVTTLLIATSCITDKEDDGPFLRKDGPRSLSKELYGNTQLGYSFAYPKTWVGGLLQGGETVAYWTADTGIASVMVYECVDDVNSLCEIFEDIDREYGVPGVQMRQGVEVIVGITNDTTANHIGMVQRMHFKRGNTLVMLWLRGYPADVGSDTDLNRIDSSLTFF
jgi:hypothetical protein